MSQARVLYDLQQIDSEIRAKKQRLGEVLRLQKEPAILIAARETATAAEAELARWRARHNELTLEIGSVSDKAKRSEERLYSGVVKNPKELNDLQHEVEALGRRRATLEDEALKTMVTVDERQATSHAAAAEVERLAGEHEATVVTLKGEQQTLAVRLNQLLEKRGRQVTLAQPAMLKAYDQLIQEKRGLAVAGLRGSKCQGCQVTISASTMKAAGEGKLVRCDSCGRILCPL
jgi:predicted  nucleic acid-binding Zn-ribbon protein